MNFIKIGVVAMFTLAATPGMTQAATHAQYRTYPVLRKQTTNLNCTCLRWSRLQAGMSPMGLSAASVAPNSHTPRIGSIALFYGDHAGLTVGIPSPGKVAIREVNWNNQCDAPRTRIVSQSELRGFRVK